MKLWLDDVRDPTVEGDWVIARTADEALEILKNNDVSIVSLDHDLGDVNEKTGYDVLCEMEQWVHDDPEYIPPMMYVHSANPVGRTRMNQVIQSIKKKVWQ